MDLILNYINLILKKQCYFDERYGMIFTYQSFVIIT